MPSNNTPSQHHYNKSLHRREFDVFSPDGLVCYTVPAGRIAHFGDESKRMMVCRNYANGSTCPMGNHCKFVHIDVPLNTLRSGAIHTHYVWRDPSVVTYDRLAPSMAKIRNDIAEAEASDLKLTVFGPNNRAPSEQVRAGDLLLTVGGERAFAIAMGEREIDTTKSSPHPCHCAHFYFNQVCNRGAGCGFVHVISLNPKQAEAKVRHSNFHKRLEAIGCQYIPAKDDLQEENANDEADEIHGNARRVSSGVGKSTDARPIRIPKGATIRPSSPVARHNSAVGSKRSSRAVSVSMEKKKSAAASFEDITAITGQAEPLDTDNHPPIWIPSVHVGALPAPTSAPQNGPLSVVVGIRSQAPSHNASSTLLHPPTNGGHERRASLVHSRRPSEQESLMHSCNSFGGQFPMRGPLPPPSSSSNQQVSHLNATNNINNCASNDPLSFASQTQYDNFSTDRGGAEEFSQGPQQQHQQQQNYIATHSANVSRRPSNVMESSNRTNLTNIGGNSFNNGAQLPVEPLTNASLNFNEDDSFNRPSGLGHTRFASNSAPNGNNLFTVTVASATASTNNSFAYNNGQAPYVPSQNANSAPNAYTLSIGDLRQPHQQQPQWKRSTDDFGATGAAATGKPYFDNVFDVNMLQQKQQEDQAASGFDSAPQSFSQDVHFMNQRDSRSGSAAVQQAPPTPQSSSHFPSPQHNYTTETMQRVTNLHHIRNAVNASEGGNSSNAYNFSNSNNFNSSNPQRGHARQGSQGLDYATPSKVTTSPGRYAHNPYGGGNASSHIGLGGSMLGTSGIRQDVEAGE